VKIEDIYNKLKELITVITKVDFPEVKVVFYTPMLFKHRIYYGEYSKTLESIDASNPLQVLRETALVKNIIGTYLFSVGNENNKYKWFCYPEILGEGYIFYDTATDIALVQDVVQKINVTNESELSTRYNCYRSYQELNDAITISIKSRDGSIATNNSCSQLPLITVKLDNFNRTSLCIKQNVEYEDSKYQLNSLFGMKCTATINVFSDKVYEAENISNKIRLYAYSELQNKYFEDMIVISKIRNIDLSEEEQFSNSKSVAGIVFELRYNDYVKEDIDIITNIRINAKTNERNSIIDLGNK
jgi:hypothetical protein